MTAKPTEIKEALSHFKDFEHVFLATIDGNHPRVRPVTLINLNKRFWVTTDTNSAKVKQIEKNPNMELCLLFTEQDMDCCARVAGLAKIIRDKDTKTKIAKRCDFFSKHWESVDDPNYTLLEICPAEIEIVTPEKTTRLKL